MFNITLIMSIKELTKTKMRVNEDGLSENDEDIEEDYGLVDEEENETEKPLEKEEFEDEEEGY